MTGWVESLSMIQMVEAVGYLDFINLVANACVVFTDSGGVQQEACIHHVPCVTLRDNTEWTDTLAIGANRLAGCDPEKIMAAAEEARRSQCRWEIPFGGGNAAGRIVSHILQL